MHASVFLDLSPGWWGFSLASSVANTGFCVSPWNHLGHPGRCHRRLMQVRWECLRNVNRLQNVLFYIIMVNHMLVIWWTILHQIKYVQRTCLYFCHLLAMEMYYLRSQSVLFAVDLCTQNCARAFHLWIDYLCIEPIKRKLWVMWFVFWWTCAADRTFQELTSYAVIVVVS